MKSVLISIKPQYCELIASGNKTIEVRKSEPKLKTPFKCYIYMTKGKWYKDNKGKWHYGSGKIIGKFICNLITRASTDTKNDTNLKRILSSISDKAFVSVRGLQDYANAKDVYGWHISDLKIYDTPKELSEFRKPGGRQCVSDNGICCRYIQASPGDDPADANTMSCIYGEQNCPFEYLNHPPQSWCYVEERSKINANL